MQEKLNQFFVKKTKPGLSSFANDPTAAVPPLLKLLAEGAEKVPVKERAKTSLTIFGTAGMRLLAPTTQASIWEAVKTGLLAATKSYPFSDKHLLVQTISGNDEGLWAVYNANFLTGRMSHDLLSNGKAAPLGLMDLGGSSTQIAIPAAAAAQKGSNFGQDALVHSYLGFGMTVIREQMQKGESCYMKGTALETGGAGTGVASECRARIREMLAELMRACHTSESAEKPCLGALGEEPAAVQAIKEKKVDFYAVAGMTYVVDFVKFYLERNAHIATAATNFLKSYPSPTLAELETAVDAACAGDYQWVAKGLAGDKEKQHSFTGSDNAPYRCFQANYILVLLGETYGFPIDGRSITFLLDVDGEDLEWPLGALLHLRSQRAMRGEEL